MEGKTKTGLKYEMRELIDYARLEYEKVKDKADPHVLVCHEVANKFRLWTRDARFPTWLARVVEGVITDIKEHLMEY